MAGKGRKPSPASKMVPDFGLWAQVSKTVEPLNPDLVKELEQFEAKNRPIMQNACKPAVPVMSVNNLKKSAARFPNPKSFEFTGLDRRQQQKLLRGQVEIDGRIDLHGESLETARMKLWRFLLSCAEQRLRTVLVITGKGSSDFTRHTLHGRDFHQSPQRDGRLRNALPDWLHEPEFRSLVSGFQPAHPKHGGGGAVYIKLRNINKSGR